jgi:hypothetical protein
MRFGINTFVWVSPFPNQDTACLAAKAIDAIASQGLLFLKSLLA